MIGARSDSPKAAAKLSQLPRHNEQTPSRDVQRPNHCGQSLCLFREIAEKTFQCPAPSASAQLASVCSSSRGRERM